jgi:hypothetical protein
VSERSCGEKESKRKEKRDLCETEQGLEKARDKERPQETKRDPKRDKRETQERES